MPTQRMIGKLTTSKELPIDKRILQGLSANCSGFTLKGFAGLLRVSPGKLVDHPSKIFLALGSEQIQG
jgi:hypothetical protein